MVLFEHLSIGLEIRVIFIVDQLENIPFCVCVALREVLFLIDVGDIIKLF